MRNGPDRNDIIEPTPANEQLTQNMDAIEHTEHLQAVPQHPVRPNLHIQTQPIPFYQRMVHALCLILTPFLFFRLLSWIFKYQLFPGLVEVPMIAFLKRWLEATPYYANSTTIAYIPEAVLQKFISSLAMELGLDQDWWLTKLMAAFVFFIYTFSSSLVISLSASFHLLCFLFIMGKRWTNIGRYVSHFRDGEPANLGVF